MCKDSKIKIAYLVLCHSNPAHIARLVKKLSWGENHVFVHVDKKTDIQPFTEKLESLKNCTVLDKRVEVFWGGYSSIDATILLMKTALLKGEFDRFVILQGLDYPIKNNDEIEKFFIDNKETEFISAQNISIRKDARSIHKYRLYHFLDNPHSIRAMIWQRIKMYCLKKDIMISFKPNTVKDNSGNKMEIFQGCAQIALTKDAVQYIVEFNEKNKKFNKFFKTMFAVDEAYFHTIIYNSKFREKATGIINKEFPKLLDFRNLTYFEYPDVAVIITVLKDKKDYEKLKNSGYLYFRKVTEESYRLLDYIDNIHEKELSV